MMRKFTATALCILLTMAIFSTVYASNGTQIGNVGARGTAMASCFRGLADDWSALFFNPAGLTQLDTKWTFGASAGLIMPRGCYDQAAYPADQFPFSGMHTETACDATPQNFYVPSAGIFFKPSETIVVGLGVFAPFGLGTEWDLMSLPQAYGNSLSKENEHKSDHQVVVFQPTVGIKLSDKISLGLGLSYIMGDMLVDNVVLPLNPAAANWTSLQGLAQMYQQTLSDLGPDQYRIAVENNLDGSGSAYGVNFGIHVNLSEKFAFGLSGIYYTDLKLSGTFTQTMNMYGDPAKAGAIMGIPAEVLQSLGINQTELAGLFSGQDVAMVDESDAEADLPLPMTLGAGIAFKPSPKLTITADASWTNWGSWDTIPIKGADGEEIASFTQNWDNTIQMGAGFEWMVMEKENTQLFWRGGFYTVDSPAPNETMTPTILDPIRRYVFTGGLGLNFGKVAINLAYEYIHFADKDVPDYEFDAETGVAENYAGNYQFKAHVITLGTSIGL